MSLVDGTSVAAPPGQLPNAQRDGAIGVPVPEIVSRTVRDEWAVFTSAVSYERKLGSPSSVRAKVPAAGMVRSLYSIRTLSTMGLPSGCVGTGNTGKSRELPGATSPCQPASTTV